MRCEHYSLYAITKQEAFLRAVISLLLRLAPSPFVSLIAPTFHPNDSPSRSLSSLRIVVRLSLRSCHSLYISFSVVLKRFFSFSRVPLALLPRRIHGTTLIFRLNPSRFFLRFTGVYPFCSRTRPVVPLRVVRPSLSIQPRATQRRPCSTRDVSLSFFRYSLQGGAHRRPARKDTRSIARTYTHTSLQPPRCVCVGKSHATTHPSEWLKSSQFSAYPETYDV